MNARIRTASSAAVTVLSQLPDLLVEKRDVFSESPDSGLVTAQLKAQLHAHEDKEHDGHEEEQADSMMPEEITKALKP